MICYRDWRGVRHCDHVHAEDLPTNGGGAHDPEPQPPTNWTAQSINYEICYFCDATVPEDEYYAHTHAHWEEMNG